MNKHTDDLLNECLERIVFRGESLEDVLKTCPAEAAELKPLLTTALKVKQAASISPRPEFRARARYEFHRALAEQKTARRGFSLLGFMPRWATALSAAMAVILVSGGTVAASTSSMPDSPLYPIKLATEQARLAVTLSDEAKAELYTELTDNRVNEIVYLANKGDTEQITVLSARLDEQMNNLPVMAMNAYGKNSQAVQVYSGPTEAASRSAAEPNPNSLKAAQPAAQPPMVAGSAPTGEGGFGGGAGTASENNTSIPVFGGPATGPAVPSPDTGVAVPPRHTAATGPAPDKPQAPPVATQSAQPAQGDINSAPTPANSPALLAAEPASPGPQLGVTTAGAPDNAGAVSDAGRNANKIKNENEQKLRALLAAYAVKHPAQLRTALEKVPEPARQSILNSIANTAAGYERALRSIEEP